MERDWNKNDTIWLAKKFSSILREWLTEEEMRLVNQKNSDRLDGSCASHDYCDANMAMVEAFAAMSGESISNENIDLVNDAWHLARRSKFNVA